MLEEIIGLASLLNESEPSLAAARDRDFLRPHRRCARTGVAEFRDLPGSDEISAACVFGNSVPSSKTAFIRPQCASLATDISRRAALCRRHELHRCRWRLIPRAPRQVQASGGVQEHASDHLTTASPRRHRLEPRCTVPTGAPGPVAPERAPTPDRRPPVHVLDVAVLYRELPSLLTRSSYVRTGCPCVADEWQRPKRGCTARCRRRRTLHSLELPSVAWAWYGRAAAQAPAGWRFARPGAAKQQKVEDTDRLGVCRRGSRHLQTCGRSDSRNLLLGTYSIKGRVFVRMRARDE